MKDKFVQHLKVLTNSFLDFIYPRICLHCQLPIKSKAVLFCTHCSEDFFLSEKLWFDDNQLCISIFDSIGAVKSLERALKKPHQLFLAKQLAHFYFVVWAKQNWPLPSIILSFKDTPFYQRDCPKKIIATKLAKQLRSPYLCLKEKKKLKSAEGKIVLLIELSINEEKWQNIANYFLKSGAKKVYGLCLTSS